MADAPQPFLRSRAPNAMFDMYAAHQISDVFADGIGQVMYGPLVTKLEFFRLLGFEGEGASRVEKREVFLRMTIPSAAIVEAAGTLLATYAGASSQFEQAAKMINEIVVGSIKKVQDVKL
jgi:hypothetical protein